MTGYWTGAYLNGGTACSPNTHRRWGPNISNPSCIGLSASLFNPNADTSPSLMPMHIAVDGLLISRISVLQLWISCQGAIPIFPTIADPTKEIFQRTPNSSSQLHCQFYRQVGCSSTILRLGAKLPKELSAASQDLVYLILSFTDSASTFHYELRKLRNWSIEANT